MSTLIIQFFKISAVCLVSAFVLSIPSHAAKSITYYGVTWTFSEDRPTGAFVNGEPWVQGPVSLVSVTPNNNTDWAGNPTSTPQKDSGSMLVTVPNIRQGYATSQESVFGYANTKVYERERDLSLNENLPATIVNGSVLLSSVGQQRNPANNIHSTTNEICILTVLETAPPAGSFRPGIFSNVPRTVVHNESQINYSILKNLSPVAGTPSSTQIEKYLPALPWFEFDDSWVQSGYGPANNFGTYQASDGEYNPSGIKYPSDASVYGREISYKWGIVALWLNTANTNAVKRKAYIQTIQCGIDIMSYVEHGGIFLSGGGHKGGRKIPALIAALALNDAALLARVADPTKFYEDRCTFIVDQDKVGWFGNMDNGQPTPIEARYIQEDVGLADWGIKHADGPAHDDRRWGDGGVPYRYVTWPAMVGPVLAAELMGQTATWNHPAVFAYNKRFMTQIGIGDSFVKEMWLLNAKSTGKEPSVPKGIRIAR